MRTFTRQRQGKTAYNPAQYHRVTSPRTSREMVNARYPDVPGSTTKVTSPRIQTARLILEIDRMIPDFAKLSVLSCRPSEDVPTRAITSKAYVKNLSSIRFVTRPEIRANRQIANILKSMFMYRISKK